MHAVLPEKLYFGNASDGRDLRRLHEHNIAAIVDIAYEELPCTLSRDFIYHRIPLVDSDDNEPNRIRLAVNVTLQIVRLQLPVLVCCSAGLSRSPSICAIVLSQLHGQTAADHLAKIARNVALDINSGFWSSACAVFP